MAEKQMANLMSDAIKTSWDGLLTIVGETVQVLPRSGDPFEIEAVFRLDSEQFGPRFSHERINGDVPHMKYRPDETRSIASGDLIDVRDVRYRAEEIIHDGHGGFVVQLERAFVYAG